MSLYDTMNCSNMFALAVSARTWLLKRLVDLLEAEIEEVILEDRMHMIDLIHFYADLYLTQNMSLNSKMDVRWCTPICLLSLLVWPTTFSSLIFLTLSFVRLGCANSASYFLVRQSSIFASEDMCQTIMQEASWELVQSWKECTSRHWQLFKPCHNLVGCLWTRWRDPARPLCRFGRGFHRYWQVSICERSILYPLHEFITIWLIYYNDWVW